MLQIVRVDLRTFDEERCVIGRGGNDVRYELKMSTGGQTREICEAEIAGCGKRLRSV